jgi:stearoyl-CoA desaturase (delta-9 desaturase)
VKHREHHKASDTELDPHSPHHMSLWKSWTLGLKDEKYNIKLGRDWMRNKGVMSTHKYFFAYTSVYTGVISLIDPWLWLYAYLIPVSLCVWATGAFNTWGHGKGLSKLGYRTWQTEDKSVNHHLVNIITFGEGWHNNHHKDPSNPVHGENRWWEWDLNAWIIRAIRNG